MDLCSLTTPGPLSGQPAVPLHPSHSPALPYPQPLHHLGVTQASCSGSDAVTWDKVMPCLINALGHGSISAKPHTLPRCRVPSWAGQNS